MTGAIVRPAAPDELAIAAAMRARMAQEMDREWDERYPGWQARFAEYWRVKHVAGAAQFFYAQRDGEIVGTAVVSISDEYRNTTLGQPRGYVNSVYVVPEERRSGVGRALMEAGIAWLRERGCVMVRLRTSAEGRNLYESLGFVTGSEMELEL